MKLLILDGNSIANRAYYGVPMLNTADGTPTNAVFGFLNILQKLLGEEMPDAVCVAFDEHVPTFRKERFEGYKAQRKGMDEALRLQMPVIRQVLGAMRIPVYSLAGYEADDLIGTAARICGEAGWECAIATGDKDSFQLITDTTKVKLVRSRQGLQEARDYTLPVFTEEYGFPPKGIVELKALMGDASDNIPGVPGVGEKTAMTLIREYGTTEAIYSRLDTLPIRDSLRKKLESGRESMELSRWLAEICRTVPLNFEPGANLRREADGDALYQIFTALEFTRLMDKWGLHAPAAAAPAAGEAEQPPIRVTEGAEALCAALCREDWVSIRVSWPLEAAAVSSASGDYLLAGAFTPDYDGVLRRLLGPELHKAGHMVKELLEECLRRGLSAEGFVFDTALAAYLLDPTASDYPLDDLARDRAGYAVRQGGEEAGGQLTLDADTDPLTTLAREARAIRLLRPIQQAALRERGQEALLTELELPLCRVLAEMERAGVLVDTKALADYGRGLAAAAEACQKGIFDLAGHEFNINSPKQLGQVLFEERMLPAPKKTKTGWSTGAEVLEKLRGKDPIIGQILDYRELTKLKSTYADGLLRVVGEDGRIHTRFQMTVTATGRLSSAEPNLQNIPVRRELGGEFRHMFLAGPGCVLVDADYSQIELRLLAHMSGDSVMRQAFLSGEDIHAVTASQVFGVPLEEVSSVMRGRAKAVNFGIVYGISAFSLGQNIGVSGAEAKAYMDSYLEKYAGVREYQKEIVKQAARDGYVSTLFGRRRYLPELQSASFTVRSFGERVAMNMPVQGTAADVIKRAMLLVRDRLLREGLAGRLVLQIHDELIVECPEGEAEAVAAVLREEMEAAASLSVPLVADAGWGKTWYDAK